MNKRFIGILVLIGVIILILVGLTVYLVQQQQTIQSNAAAPPTTFTASNFANQTALTPTTGAPNQLAATPTTACTLPSVVTNVQVNYPYQNSSNQVFYDEANCTWSALTGVDSYNVKVTNVGTGTVVSTQTVNSSTTNLIFTVQQGSTYKCEVSGTNACGSGPVGSGQVTCSVDGIQPTSSTSATIVPTATPVLGVATPTSAPPPQNLPSTGTTGTTLAITIVGTLFVAAGGALLFGL